MTGTRTRCSDGGVPPRRCQATVGTASRPREVILHGATPASENARLSAGQDPVVGASQEPNTSPTTYSTLYSRSFTFTVRLVLCFADVAGILFAGCFDWRPRELFTSVICGKLLIVSGSFYFDI